MVDAPAIGESLLVSLTLRVSAAAVGQWCTQRVEVVAIAKSAHDAASSAGEVLAQKDDAQVVCWHALPLTFWKEWAESMWANITAPQPKLFVVYRTEEGGTLLPLLTVAGDEAAGHSEVDATVLATPLPNWLAERVEAFVAVHYKPQVKKVRRRQ